MDSFLDAVWCPVCDRQILPKRYSVPVAPPPTAAPTAPAPPPASPSSSPSPSKETDMTRRTSTRKTNGGAARRGGLLQGTGRVKPNGTIRRTDSNLAKKQQQQQQQPPQPPAAQATTTTEEQPKPAAPIKHRTVIDQGPIPLYCSDECRLKDLANLDGAIPPDFNPQQHSPTLPPVPHNSYSALPTSSSETESDSSSATSSASVESRTSVTLSSASSDDRDVESSSRRSTATQAHLPKHIATLSQIYNFPPIPPAPPLLSRTESPASDSRRHEYGSGIMMAARRMKEALSPPTNASKLPGSSSSSPSSSSPASRRLAALARENERKPIPGWTDGSDAWRSSVYSFSPPKQYKDGQHPNLMEDCKAYQSFAASPHRSKGVYSTLSESTPTNSCAAVPTRSSTAEELYSKYPLGRSKRSDSRLSIASDLPVISHSLPTPSTSSTTSRRREHKLVKPGAEGKLLVPDVKMSSSVAGSSRSPPTVGSFSSTTGSSWASYYPRSTASIPSIRSPLSRTASELPEDASDVGSVDVAVESSSNGKDVAMSLPAAKRPGLDGRTWSYDNFLTYDAMPLPTKKVTRKEKKVVDGQEKEVEVEDEVVECKKLFLFPSREAVRA